jgi:hypothetical protein
LDVDQSYTVVGTSQPPAKADVTARFPNYRVDGTLSFSGYNPNAAVSPAAFTSP